MKKNIFFRLLLLFFIFFLFPNVYAQSKANVIYYNEPIRIIFNDPMNPKIQATFDDFGKDTAFVHLGQREKIFALQEIKEIQVIRGKKSNKGKGAIYGGLLGGFGLGLIAAIDVSDEQGGWFVPTPAQAFTGGLVGGGLLGSLAGAIIGSGFTSPKWVSLDLNTLQIAKKPGLDSTMVPDSAIKQKLPEKKQATLRKFSISVDVGVCTAGPATDIEAAMRANGWDDTSPGGWFSEPQAHPHTNKSAAFAIQIAYRLHPYLSIALAYNPSISSTTWGYRKDIAEYMKIDYKSLSIAPMAIFHIGHLVNISAGPAWFINTMEHKKVDQVLYREQKGRLGFIFKFAFSFPQNTRFFLMLDAQYRFVPAATYGPFKTSYRKTNYEELNAFKANFSHGYLGAGLGIRF